MSMESIRGTAFLAIFISGSWLIWLATNRLMPYGGVIKPMASSIVITTPNCTVERPHSRTVGSSMGARMMVAEMLSMKQPTIKRRMVMRPRITMGLSETLVSIVHRRLGICLRVRTRPREVVMPTMNSVEPLMSTASIMDWTMSFHFSS